MSINYVHYLVRLKETIASKNRPIALSEFYNRLQQWNAEFKESKIQASDIAGYIKYELNNNSALEQYINQPFGWKNVLILLSLFTGIGTIIFGLIAFFTGKLFIRPIGYELTELNQHPAIRKIQEKNPEDDWQKALQNLKQYPEDKELADFVLKRARAENQWEKVKDIYETIKNGKEDYVLTAGPLPKNIYTYQLENLFIRLLGVNDEQDKFKIVNNESDENILEFQDGSQYNLTDIFRHANLEHLTFKDEHFKNYNHFSDKHFGTNLLDGDFEQIRKKTGEFENLNLAEMKALNTYTTAYYTDMNGLLRGFYSFNSRKPEDVIKVILSTVMCASALSKIGNQVACDLILMSEKPTLEKIKKTDKNNYIIFENNLWYFEHNTNTLEKLNVFQKQKEEEFSSFLEELKQELNLDKKRPISVQDLEAITWYTRHFYAGKIDEPSFVFRGISLYSTDVLSNQIEAAVNKEVVSLDGFVSSSEGDVKARYNRGVVFKFFNLRGKRIESIAGAVGESEYLIPPTKIQITNYTVEKGTHIFEVSTVTDLAKTHEKGLLSATDSVIQQLENYLISQIKRLVAPSHSFLNANPTWTLFNTHLHQLRTLKQEKPELSRIDFLTKMEVVTKKIESAAQYDTRSAKELQSFKNTIKYTLNVLIEQEEKLKESKKLGQK